MICLGEFYKLNLSSNVVINRELLELYFIAPRYSLYSIGVMKYARFYFTLFGLLLLNWFERLSKV